MRNLPTSDKRVTRQKRMRRMEMERLKREAEERRREKKLLQDIDRSKRFVREYEEEERRKEKEKKENLTMGK